MHRTDSAEPNRATGRSVSDAYRYAEAAHRGQRDKQDRDYLRFHLVPVAAALLPYGHEAVQAGLLHDIVEDTDVTLLALLDEGFSEQVVAAVASVTRGSRETYRQLIERSAEHRLGHLLKLADNTLNIASNDTLAATDPDSAKRLMNGRYLPARDRLTEALASHDPDASSEAVLEGMRDRIRLALNHSTAPEIILF